MNLNDPDDVSTVGKIVRESLVNCAEVRVGDEAARRISDRFVLTSRADLPTVTDASALGVTGYHRVGDDPTKYFSTGIEDAKETALRWLAIWQHAAEKEERAAAELAKVRDELAHEIIMRGEQRAGQWRWTYDGSTAAVQYAIDLIIEARAKP